MSNLEILRKIVAILIIQICFILIVSCDKATPEGFSTTKSNLIFKRLNIGEDRPNINKGDIITVFLKIQNDNNNRYDSKLESFLNKIDGKHHFKLVSNEKDGGIEEALLMMTEGDSIMIISKLENLTNFAHRYLKISMNDIPVSNELLKINIAIMHHYPLSYYKNLEEEYAHWEKSESEEYENQAINIFKENAGISFVNGISNILVSQTLSEEKTVRNGDVMQIHYKGYFLNGEIFDNSYLNENPVDYIVGKPDQLIAGLELVLPYIQKNTTIDLIIPSYLAYGKKGSITGIVPPDTPLYYELSVVDIINQ